ncbi:hypothetical protein G7Y89_g3435 [Cudoniella acicularis]|uniref:Uncharacterized protein n=1 Tax=Cudoniella acicularis TaxID=354080 RepID=A0A8H4RRC9_9HELO|nr:hypothetical protein G7Y89_g3435 [Cudoniella acicularis]
MFGNRRRRAPSNPPLNGSISSPSAATAAAQAFLKDRASNASLSSAAAAAALRSRPVTPTSVADVQTKRTIRRAASTSSAGSAASTQGPPGSQLERRGSIGSMSERTFRDPSPARQSSAVPSAPDAPPVPAIPKDIQPSIPPKSHRRATSLEAPAARVASPPPNMASGRGSSLGPVGIAQNTRRAGHRTPSLSTVQELTGTDRPASRGSVNFSLPTSSRPTSPIAQRRLTSPSPQRAKPPVIVSPTNQNLVYDPNTRSFLPQAEILAIEQKLQDAANTPVKRKKRIAPKQATGTHLADGTVGGRPKGTAIDAMEAASNQEPPAEPPAPVPESIPEPTPVTIPPTAAPKRKKKKKKVVISDSDSDQASYIPNSSDNDSDIVARPTQPVTFNTRAGALLAKKPSIVREDREREEEEDQYALSMEPLLRLDTSPATARTTSPTPLPWSGVGRGHGRGQASASAAFAEGRQHTRSASQPAPALQDSSLIENGASPAARASVREGRVQSLSPARTTHFATATDNLVVKHQPPPRSISPRKSALKHASMSRGYSPSSDEAGTVANGPANGELSEELIVPRKKANRVSFDETNVVVGQAATPVTTDSPIVQSPQTKRPWYSIGKGKKKDTSVLDENDDEVMKPRPALPSFGSVRKNQAPKEIQERPLVKPPAPEDQVLSIPSPPLFTTPTGEVIEYPLGQSNDHVVGAIISQDAASRNAANISKSREPLPPQVTSVEGNGYVSDSSSENSVDFALSTIVTQPMESKEPITMESASENLGMLSKPAAEQETGHNDNQANGDVPKISVPQATPTLENMDSRKEWLDMPGSWRSSNSDSGSQNQDDVPQPIVEHHASEPTPAGIGIAEPTLESAQSSLPVLDDIAAENSRSHPTSPVIIEESENSDTDSIYSDAAEDLSDLEGDGFMSLDAVVESPVVPISAPGLTISTPPESPTTKAIKERAYRNSQLSRKSSEPELDEGWQKAQEYWKGLTAEKRHQLELEARAEAEEDSHAEVEVKQVPTPEKKKRVLKPALKPTPQRQSPVNNERTYMITPGTKAGSEGQVSLRLSMRAEPPNSMPETHMRKSMRGPRATRTSLRNSMESGETRGTLQKKHRPMSLPTSELRPDPAAVEDLVRKLSAANAQAAPVAAKQTTTTLAPKLRRRGSGDSDSSFKRERSRPSSDIPSFRRSMRSSAGESVGGRQQSPITSSRFSLRSLSPTGSSARRPFSGSGASPKALAQTHMRNSMRNSSGSIPTLRGNRSGSPGKSSLRLSSFGRSTPKRPKTKSASTRSSRFNDSSDEEDSRPAFRSRFDSSDEDEPLPSKSTMPASMRSNSVRRIPRREGLEDGDSSDLPDSDDEKPASLRKRGQNGTINKKSLRISGITDQGHTSNQGSALASGTLQRSGSGRGTISPTTANGPGIRPNQLHRGSFMSILRRKKPDPSSKVRKSDAESPARRDTPLERSKSDLADLKTERPSTPKLQKRHPNGTWPLPAPASPPQVVGGEDERPFTADTGDGVVGGESAAPNGVERPDLGNRRFTATGLSAVDIKTNGTGKAKKKKKFGTLRRMFRLDD